MPASWRPGMEPVSSGIGHGRGWSSEAVPASAIVAGLSSEAAPASAMVADELAASQTVAASPNLISEGGGRGDAQLVVFLFYL